MLGAIPFVLVMMLMAILILVFPSIALWLPGVLG
jgi:TRAP-type mannitol/chloroaromatic compound transport system permease large subunit